MRNIFLVNATQVVVSENNPGGMFSVMTGFPKTFDSTSYNGDIEQTLKAAKSAYYDQLSKNYGYTNRAMTTVTLTAADGKQLLHECIGGFPVTEVEEPEEVEE